MAKAQRIVSAAQGVDILKEYEAGASLMELAEKYKVSAMTISRTITRAGGNTRGGGRPSIYTDEQLQKLRREYENGATLRYLSAVYGGHHTNIGNAIEKAGGILRGRRRKGRRTGILSWLDS
jgi:hypothetical protein